VTWLSDAAVARLRDVAEWPVIPGGRYDVLAPIARGGMGTVYRGHDRELDRDVAIKVLWATTADDGAARRMRREARVLARLEHPGIVPVYDSGLLEDGRMFYIMKLVQGLRLDEHVAERPLAERLRTFTRVCDAVAFAHAHGVVHRDLKPENVMVGPFGEVLVMDWGVAQLLGDTGIEKHPGSVVGTLGYMAPEQARGEDVDGRADVYALGGLLQFLLTGVPPDAAALRGPRPLQAICRKSRAPDPDSRYANASALAHDVNQFLAGEPVAAEPERTIDRLARFVRKYRAPILVVTVYLVLRVLIAWLAP
jgi:eukaryotic-like serine/threonine-protein kinase